MEQKKSTRPLVVAIELVAFALLVVWFVGSRPTPVPSVQWRLVDGESEIAPFAKVDAETELTLDLDLPFPASVWVASFEPVRGPIAMFPSAYLRSDLPANPLPAGRHRLPGRQGGKALAWHSGDVLGPISFLVIVSREPLPELDAALRTFRQLGNAAFPQRTRLDCYAPEGGMQAVPARSEVPSGLLRNAFTLPAAHHDGPMVADPGHPGVFLQVMRLVVDPGAPAEPVERLRELLGPLAPTTFPPAPK